MATLPDYATVPNVRGYTSSRVFDGVRKLDKNATLRHKARLAKALAKREAQKQKKV